MKSREKWHFLVKLPPFWAKKIGKTQKFQKMAREKFYLLENFNLTNFGLNLTIFEKEDSFLAFFAPLFLTFLHFLSTKLVQLPLRKRL